MPVCLQVDQERDQSVEGLASSALEGMKSYSPGSVSCMVMKFSVRSLVQSFSVILTILMEEDSFTVLMMLNSSMVRYGGGGARGFRNILTQYMFSEEEIVEKIGLEGGVCCCLQESGNETCKGLVFDGMQSQATMMVRSVDDHFLRFGKHVLIEPRFA